MLSKNFKLEIDGWTYVYVGPEIGFARYQTRNEHSDKADENYRNLIIAQSEERTPTNGNDSY